MRGEATGSKRNAKGILSEHTRECMMEWTWEWTGEPWCSFGNLRIHGKKGIIIREGGNDGMDVGMDRRTMV